MSGKAQGTIFVVTVIALSATVGRAATGDSQAVRATALIVVASLGLVVLQRPVVAVHAGITLQVIQLVASSSLPSLAA